MGGYGSGRWGSEVTKYTVEDCQSLKIKDIASQGILEPGLRAFRSVTWRNSFTDEITSSICYEIDTSKDDLSFYFIRLFYTMTRTQEKIDYKIPLVTTQPNFGGLRWWFQCPLVINDRPCLRKVSAIHRTPNGRYYGCRHCLRLTYRSCQESDKRVSWLKNNPVALESLLSRVSDKDGVSNKDLFMALKVLHSAEKHF
jgi:hypothetical protein